MVFFGTVRFAIKIYSDQCSSKIFFIISSANLIVGDHDANRTLQKLDEYSFQLDKLTDEMSALVENTKEKYFVLTHSNYEWCGVTIDRFQVYLQRIQNATKDEAMKQHRTEIQVLKDGLNKITSAHQGLEKTYSNFLAVARENSGQTAQLNGDFNRYSDYRVEELLIRLMIETEKSRRCVLHICWDTDKTHQIRSLIETIEKKRDKILLGLEVALQDAGIHMDKMKTTFGEDILAIRNVIPEVQAAMQTINDVIEEDLHDSVSINEIKIAVQKLIEECCKYRARHEP